MTKKIIIGNPGRSSAVQLALKSKCGCDLHVLDEVSKQDVVQEFKYLEINLTNSYKEPDKFFPFKGSKYHK